MHTIRGYLSKFNTSLACKSIFTIFVATEMKNVKKKKINKNKKKVIHFSSKFRFFRQQYRRKMYKLRKKYMYIYPFFRSLYIFLLYSSLLSEG